MLLDVIGTKVFIVYISCDILQVLHVRAGHIQIYPLVAVIAFSHLYSTSTGILLRGAANMTTQDHDQTEWSSTAGETEAEER